MSDPVKVEPVLVCAEDEADARQLYRKLRDALPKRFKVKAPTSVSFRD